MCVAVLQSAFDNATFKNWMVNGKLAGRVKTGGGLTFVEVANAGHMVPLNQPEAVSVGSSLKEMYAKPHLACILYSHTLLAYFIATPCLHNCGSNSQ